MEGPDYRQQEELEQQEYEQTQERQDDAFIDALAEKFPILKAWPQKENKQ